MIVEVEVYENADDLACYSGIADDALVKNILAGKNEVAFLTLENVFWTRTKERDSEWEEEESKLCRYGIGEYANYSGTMHIRIDKIINISELRGIAKTNGEDMQGA